MARADIMISPIGQQLLYSGAGTNSPVLANNGAFYIVYVDTNNDISFRKSTDGGFTWSHPTVVFAGTVVALATCYDRNCGLSTDKIRCAYTESGGSDILYRDIDTASSDALGTQTTVFDGTSSAGGGALTITIDRGGHLRVAGSIDAGAEDGAWSSDDDGATWGDSIADPSEGATQDQYLLLPGWNADNHDVMLIFVDASTNGLSVKRYDDSGDSWAEAAIIADGSFVDLAAANGFPHIAAFVDVANSRNVVFAWSAVDSANSDLRCFVIDDTTITETSANVVLNSTDDQGLVAASLDTTNNVWYSFYVGKSDGSETWSSAVNVYYKTSSDLGATWSAETQLTTRAHSVQWIGAPQRFTGNFTASFHDDIAASTVDSIKISVLIPSGSGGGGSPIIGSPIIR